MMLTLECLKNGDYSIQSLNKFRSKYTLKQILKMPNNFYEYFSKACNRCKYDSNGDYM